MPDYHQKRAPDQPELLIGSVTHRATFCSCYKIVVAAALTKIT
jgi:hypothetical protein